MKIPLCGFWMELWEKHLGQVCISFKFNQIKLRRGTKFNNTSSYIMYMFLTYFFCIIHILFTYLYIFFIKDQIKLAAVHQYIFHIYHAPRSFFVEYFEVLRPMHCTLNKIPWEVAFAGQNVLLQEISVPKSINSYSVDSKCISSSTSFCPFHLRWLFDEIKYSTRWQKFYGI